MAEQQRMWSRVNVRRSTGRTTQDESTGREVPQWATVRTDSPFRLRGGRGSSTGTKTVTTGGVELQLATAEGHLPAGTEVRDGDLLEVTEGENAGTVWRVVESGRGDQQTAVRVPVIEARRPVEWGPA